eukprot:GHVS01006172.1.p1 GENE.GHVS01006172.1~~GHVS01006172.1.p1  ORF type:complete len:299 (+),score=67.86 GHVS01006172.1:309-1205(+)
MNSSATSPHSYGIPSSSSFALGDSSVIASECRRLQRCVERELLELSQLGGGSLLHQRHQTNCIDVVQAEQRMVTDIQNRIEQKLNQLEQTITTLEQPSTTNSSSTGSGGNSPSTTTITSSCGVASARTQRLRNIMDGLRREYDIVRWKVTDNLQRTSLLLQADKKRTSDGDGRRDSQDHNNAIGMMAKERTALDSSINMIDNLVQQGRDTHGKLKDQRGRFENINKKMYKLRKEYLPDTTKIINKINKIKYKHRIIIACTFGCCLLICLMWIFRRRDNNNTPQLNTTTATNQDNNKPT